VPHVPEIILGGGQLPAGDLYWPKGGGRAAGSASFAADSVEEASGRQAPAGTRQRLGGFARKGRFSQKVRTKSEITTGPTTLPLEWGFRRAQSVNPKQHIYDIT
jgi:hypothetical protein